jgi:hypothetical protein
LETLYELEQIPSAKALWETIQGQRPVVNTTHVDRQACKINTEWQSAIDSEKTRRFEQNQNAKKKSP